MGEYDTWRARIASIGSSQSNALENQTIQFINAKFADSPMYMQVPINGVTTSIRLLRDMDEDDSDTKRILFLPNETVNKGSIVQIYGDNWLVNTVDDHPYFPTGHLLRCSDSLRWYLSNGVTQKTYPCAIIPTTKNTMDKADKMLEMAMYQLHIFVQFNADTETIGKGMRFILGNNNAVEIVGVDGVSNIFDGEGYLDLSANIVTLTPNDNLTTKYADNSAYYLPQKNSSGGGISW